MTNHHLHKPVRPGGDRPSGQAGEHARELVDRLASRGLRASGEPHRGSLAGGIAVAAQRVDVRPYAGRLVVLLPDLRDPRELVWNWPRLYSGHEHTGAHWFQPFGPARAYDAVADKVVAAIDADVRRRRGAAKGRALLARPGGEAGERQVLDNVGRPLHKLVYRQVVALDAAQRNVEDPALLRRLYEIDHLAMRTLRGLERIAVLGGATARQLPRPMPLPTAMMQATAQVEHYSRVRIPPPGFDVELPRDVAPEITLLLAELIENATRFSPRDTEVVVAAEAVTSAGVRIEIIDRGLSMPQGQRASLNRLLAAPDSADLREQIIGKRIGLLVVARLAERHGVRVVLHPRTGAGTRAVVEVPESLLCWAQLPLLPPEPAARVITGVLEPEAEPQVAVPVPVLSSRTDPEPIESADPAEPIESADALLPRRRTSTAAATEPVPTEPVSAPETDSAAGGPPLPQRTGAHRRGGSHRVVSGPNTISGPTGPTGAGAGIGAADAFLQGVRVRATPAAAQTPDQAEGGPPPEPPK
ncbi:sensor histidine kinase [Actinomadura geliboluensis]|uniref:sensor histidine kinase n=1 Tax=Actinomadura geliboluensis TaxID=882440 RepID=UPI0026159537|nr:ATP-binding protein [Actinomadura geliboluensis]